MKILITGSEGLLGKLTQEALINLGEISGIDIKGNPSVDLLNDPILPYFKDIESVVHLAAHPLPWITPKEAKENVDMTYNVLEACRISGVKRIVYASSINVYDIKNLYPKRRITAKTPATGNTKTNWKYGNGEGHFYPMSKIACEAMVNAYCRQNNIQGINLRFGCVTPNDIPYKNEPEDNAAWLGHIDFKEIIKRAIEFQGLTSLTCVSNNEEKFVDIQPLIDKLGYFPMQNSESKNHSLINLEELKKISSQ